MKFKIGDTVRPKLGSYPNNEDRLFIESRKNHLWRVVQVTNDSNWFVCECISTPPIGVSPHATFNVDEMSLEGELLFREGSMS